MSATPEWQRVMRGHLGALAAVACVACLPPELTYEASHDSAAGSGGTGAPASGGASGGNTNTDGSTGMSGAGALMGGAGGVVESGGAGGGLEGGTAAGGAGPCIVQVTAGGYHTCARKRDGTLWCWGYNYSGQLGDGTTQSPKPWPVEVTALGADVAEVSAGGNYTCARKGDGTLWCWGLNGYGELGEGTTQSPKPSPVEVPGLGANVVEVSAGGNHACARKGDGTLWCWGLNVYGQLGDGTMESPKPSPVEVPGLGANVVDVSAGGNHTCARRGDGTLWCWGNNVFGGLGDGTTVTPKTSPVEVTALGANLVEVTAGQGYTCARTGDGTLWCWGNNMQGQLGDGTIASPRPSPVEVTDLVVEVAAGGSHTCARKGDGTLWCWGSNGDGQLGDGTTASKPSPVGVPALGANVVEVAAGGSHTCARRGDGTLWCWGDNSYGQVGDGTTDGSTCNISSGVCRTSPVQVALTCL